MSNSPSQYLPFVAHCPVCHSDLEPLSVPESYNTHPHPVHKTVPITFWCSICGHAPTYTYSLPIMRDAVSKNLIIHISILLHQDPDLIDNTIAIHEPDKIAIMGLRWAIADLQQKCLIYDVDDLSFKLTLLGKIMYWHGPY